MQWIPSWPDKDPDEVLDYIVTWGDRLGDDTIQSSVFSVVSGTVVIENDTNTDDVSTVWLSGGTLGETCEILNRITTAATREFDQTVFLRIRKR